MTTCFRVVFAIYMEFKGYEILAAHELEAVAQAAQDSGQTGPGAAAPVHQVRLDGALGQAHLRRHSASLSVGTARTLTLLKLPLWRRLAAGRLCSSSETASRARAHTHACREPSHRNTHTDSDTDSAAAKTWHVHRAWEETARKTVRLWRCRTGGLYSQMRFSTKAKTKKEVEK